MSIAPSDIIGFIGVAFVVTTYLLSQIGMMETTRPLYPALNAVGALMILVSLCYTFNLASAVIETFWLLISVAGVFRAWRSHGR